MSCNKINTNWFVTKLYLETNTFPLTLTKEREEKYLVFDTLWKKEIEDWSSLQPYLDKRPKVKDLRFQKPNAPTPFVIHNFCYFIQWIFLSPMVWPHQYLVTNPLISSHHDFGNLKQLTE